MVMVDAPWKGLRTPSEHDDPLPLETLRPTTPLPDDSRTLRRTMSYAYIDTICLPSNKGIRRTIQEIADGLRHKSSKKKKKGSPAQDVTENKTPELGSDSKAPSASKELKRGRKTKIPLRDSYRSEEQGDLAIADRLYGGIPPEQDLLDKPLSVRNLGPGTSVTAEGPATFQLASTSKVNIKDVQLDIRPSELDVTIWDGLRAAHHLFECRLFLRCTADPYNSVALPDIQRIEMNCVTHPAGTRYARPPILQTSYTGASPGLNTGSDGKPNVKLAAGIHMGRFWRTILHDDGTWGWYKDAFVPLSPRLFDKMEYREFKLLSRVWIGENCVEGELAFGISMLLRGVDMK